MSLDPDEGTLHYKGKELCNSWQNMKENSLPSVELIMVCRVECVQRLHDTEPLSKCQR